MFEKYKIVFHLFGHSFLAIASLYFIALTILTLSIVFKESYKTNIENEFATKQPHIKIKYIDDNVLLSQEKIDLMKKKIKSFSTSIDTISEYVSGKIFVNSTGAKSGGNAFYQGEIKVVGLNSKDFVYNFFDANFVSRDPFNIKYTPLEFLYFFSTTPNAVIFNKTLANSYFPVIESVQNFSFRTQQKLLYAKLGGKFNDYDNQQILYTNRKFANRLLGNDVKKVSGYFLNAKKIEDIDKLINIIKSKIDSKRYIVISWLEERQRQLLIFSIFKTLSHIIVGIVLMLSLLFNLLLIYNTIVKKSYQLSTLAILGYILKREIFILIASIVIVDTIGVLWFAHWVSPILLYWFDLPDQYLLMEKNIYFSMFVGVAFLFILYLFIRNSYAIKVKSAF